MYLAIRGGQNNLLKRCPNVKDFIFIFKVFGGNTYLEECFYFLAYVNYFSTSIIIWHEVPILIAKYNSHMYNNNDFNQASRYIIQIIIDIPNKTQVYVFIKNLPKLLFLVLRAPMRKKTTLL